jgi:hypothetical protein
VGDDVYSTMNYYATGAIDNARPFDWIRYSVTEIDQILSDTAGCQ